MRFIVSNFVLSKQLQRLGGVIANTNKTLPILDDFLFELSKDELFISASDLETTISCNIEVKSEDIGKTTIPARMLQDILKSLPDQPLTFVIDNEKNTTEIKAENGTYSLVCHSPDDYPITEEISDAKKIDVPANLIAKGINSTIFASGTDELKPVLSGVFFKFDSNTLTLVATDSHKLVKYRKGIKLNEENEEVEFIMPKKPLNLLKTIFSDTDNNIQIQYNESNIKLSFENIVLVCRLINGKYPNYEAVIPKENPNILDISKDEFLNAVKRVSIFSNKMTNQIKFNLKGSKFELSAEDIDFNNKADETLVCVYKGDDMQMGFNARYLTEVLSNLECNEVSLKMSMPNRAGVLIPNDSLEEDEEILMLVMPVTI